MLHRKPRFSRLKAARPGWLTLRAALLLLRSRSSGSLHEGLHLLQSEAAIFIGVHRLEDAFVGRLKLLQRDGPITIGVHHSEKHPHHHAGTHRSRPHHSSVPHHAALSEHAAPPTHAALPHHANHASVPHHSGTPGSRTRVVMALVLLLLLRRGLWRLARDRSLLGARSDDATRQNESGRREHQDVLLHFRSP